jgi:hypothetical protein
MFRVLLADQTDVICPASTQVIPGTGLRYARSGQREPVPVDAENPSMRCPKGRCLVVQPARLRRAPRNQVRWLPRPSARSIKLNRTESDSISALPAVRYRTPSLRCSC